MTAFLIYGVISWITKDLYPFSSYSMYAGVARMNQGNVPTFFANGEESSIADYVAFSGFGRDEMWPHPRECTLMWMVHEACRWVDEHRAEEGDDPDVPVEWGFWHVVIQPNGEVERSLDIVCRGRARRR